MCHTQDTGLWLKQWFQTIKLFFLISLVCAPFQLFMLMGLLKIDAEEKNSS